MIRISLSHALRRALDRTLPDGWLYMPRATKLLPQTECAFIDDLESELDDDGLPISPIRTEFPREGLDTQALEDTAEAARSFQDPPSNELLIESFEYYLRFDAFLPAPGAPEPPPLEETRTKLDREFYELLGSERNDQSCKRNGCSHGAIANSVLCRKHHFESIQGRTCPFDD